MKNALFSDSYENPCIDLLPYMQMQESCSRPVANQSGAAKQITAPAFSGAYFSFRPWPFGIKTNIFWRFPVCIQFVLLIQNQNVYRRFIWLSK
ncbi:MAG: hypothetical protein IPL27_13365 [Lewinellaceae bacterium]|jgi:hypothetical protein|nr:hypothetical protein [Lewinellaceae bacterium]